MHFKDIALKVPTILVPGTGTDLEKWAVVACDQFTSQPEYWHPAAGSGPGPGPRKKASRSKG